MASSRVLQPIAANPEDRLWSTLRSVQDRVAALEVRRDIIITPWEGLAVTSNVSVPCFTVPYSWKGGRMWILQAGSALTTVATATVGYYAKLSTMSPGTFFTDISGFQTNTASQNVAVPVAIADIDISYMALGNNTFEFRKAANVTTNQFRANGFFFEWPQP